MSRFYASIEGGRGQVTRQGHQFIKGHVRGWRSGVEVIGQPVNGSETDLDRFDIYTTGGSQGAQSPVYLGAVDLDTQGALRFTPDDQALRDAARAVIANWEGGDLAAAVNSLRVALDECTV